jgi:hypothetical protein
MDTIKDIKHVIESIVDVKRETVSLQEIMDDTKIARFLCEKNIKSTNPSLYEKMAKDLEFLSRLLSRIHDLITERIGTSGAIKENYKALVYKTFEDITLRIGITAASSGGDLTFFTNVISFLLDRAAEYAYVRGAKSTEGIFLAHTRTRLWEDLWEMAERNDQLKKMTFAEAKELRDRITHLVDTIESTASTEVYIHFYALVVYMSLLNILNNINEYEKFGI